MCSERHIPDREHHAEVGVSELRVSRVVETVELRSDREAVHEPGNPEPDVRVPHKTGDGLRDELPVDKLCGCAEYKER